MQRSLVTDPFEPSEIRLVATDLDGTLLRSDHSVSSRTLEALLAVEDRGIQLMVATGRPIRWIQPVIDQIGDQELVICSNGAVVFDPANHSIVEHYPLDRDLAAEVIDVLTHFDEQIGLAAEAGFDFAIGTTFETKWEPPRDMIRTSNIGLLDREITKLLARGTQYHPDQLAAVLRPHFGDRIAVTWGFDGDGGLLEIHAPGVNKGTAVSRHAESVGLSPHAVIAFGDMPNDLEMLQSSRHGVAVANAHQMILDVADETTLSNEEDGVAVVLERLLV